MPVPSKGQEGAGRGDPGLYRVGNSLGLAVPRRAPVAGPMGHSPPARRAPRHACHSQGFPPCLGTSARRKTLVMSGSLAFYPASQGAALFIHNLPAHPHPARLTARLCPEDSGLSGTSKALPSSAGGWQGGLEAGDGSGDSWIPIPAVRGEGSTRLLLIALNTHSGLLTQPPPKLH